MKLLEYNYYFVFLSTNNHHLTQISQGNTLNSKTLKFKDSQSSLYFFQNDADRLSTKNDLLFLFTLIFGETEEITFLAKFIPFGPRIFLTIFIDYR